METVSIKKQNVQKAFKEGCDDVRKVLKNLFGEDVVSSSDWISVWEEFLKEFKLDIILPYPKHTSNRQEQRTNASHMLDHIVPAERGYREPNYDDFSEWKYEPVFKMSSSGFGFARSVNVGWGTVTDCGSRLCTFSDAECKRVANKYLSIYEKKLTK